MENSPIYTLTKEILVQRADSMRNNPTPAERVFMNRLIDAKIQFNQQFIIHCYIADFLIGNIIVELDGSSHKGREEYDARRDKYMKDRGYTVIRIHNSRAGSFDLNRLKSSYVPKAIRKASKKPKKKKDYKHHEKPKPSLPYEMVQQANGDFVKVHNEGDYKTFLLKGIPYSERAKKPQKEKPWNKY